MKDFCYNIGGLSGVIGTTTYTLFDFSGHPSYSAIQWALVTIYLGLRIVFFGCALGFLGLLLQGELNHWKWNGLKRQKKPLT